MEDARTPFRDVLVQSDRPIHARVLDMYNMGLSFAGKTFDRRYIVPSRKRRYGAAIEAKELRYVQLRKGQGYIAVSCPWNLPLEEDKTRSYCIDTERNFEVKIPQNVVLDRVIRFATIEGQRRPFWIDKLCINQDATSDEKHIAIQSMDKVYKDSEISLGLLFVRMDSQGQVRHFHDLLFGQCASKRVDNQQVRICHVGGAEDVLNIIELVMGDNFWNRAWIYQEEYLSGSRMVLLIRSSVYHGSGRFSEFGHIPGELQFRAIDFRTKATNFCLMYCRQKNVAEDVRRRCSKVLQRVGKYNILLTQNRPAKSLSVFILEEIGRRGVERQFDILPIACNVCDYFVRLDTQLLQQNNTSLSLAILATYILNGEILRHGPTRAASWDGNIYAFLKQNTFRVEPPLDQEKGLTFTKHCRFPDVVLSKKGIETSGILWKLGKKIQPLQSFKSFISARCRRKIRMSRSREDSDFQYRLTVPELEALWGLVTWLRRSRPRPHKHLANSLSCFLRDTALRGYNDDWTNRHIMSIMATNLARAIRENRLLRLGCIYPDNPYSAIFVWDTPRSDNRCIVFTTWTRKQSVTDDQLLAVDCAKYASLEVNLSNLNDSRPVIKPRRWINGLCFFSNVDARGVLVPWPESITNPSLRL